MATCRNHICELTMGMNAGLCVVDERKSRGVVSEGPGLTTSISHLACKVTTSQFFVERE